MIGPMLFMLYGKPLGRYVEYLFCSMEPPCPAFVVVDSFQSTVASLVSPKCHWQLCGATLLEHTLGWLDRSNVDFAYIWCCSQESSRRVPPLVERAKCSFRSQLIEPEQVMDIDDDDDDLGGDVPPASKTSASLGDCMRYADSSDLLAKYAAQSVQEGGGGKGATGSRSALPDFLLVGGNTFAQQPLSSSMKRHRAWKEKDRSCVLTIVCSANSIHPQETGLCLVTDVNGRLLHWRDSASGESQELNFPPSLVAPKSQFAGELHVWPKIFPVAAVCSPEVLVQFADNFDYENIADVIRGLLTNEEVLGQRIYIDVIDSGLKPKDTFQNTVFHVTDLASFAFTARSVLLSATLSRTPFSLSHLKDPAYYHRFPGAFVSSKATTRLSVIEGVSFISENVLISGGGVPSLVSSSFIGPNCNIGAGCRLEESYFAENCRLEDNVTVLHSFIAHDVIVKPGSTIARGCIIGAGVTLGAGARVPPDTFIFATGPESALIGAELMRGSGQLKLTSAPVEVVGSGASECYALNIGDLPRNVQQYLVWPGLLRHAKPRLATERLGRARTVSGMEQMSLKSDTRDKDSEKDESSARKDESLDSEVVLKRRDVELDEAIDRTMRENLSADNAVLEVNSIKHAYGVGIRDLTTSVFRAILTVPLRGATQITNANALTLLKNVLSNPHVLPLARHYVKSAEAKLDCLAAVEAVAGMSPQILANLAGLLQQLYSNYDLIDDEAVKKWFVQVPAASAVKKHAQPFVTWIEQAEEESDDEDDEDDD